MRNQTAGALRQILEPLGYDEDDFIQIAQLISEESKWNTSEQASRIAELKEDKESAQKSANGLLNELRTTQAKLKETKDDYSKMKLQAADLYADLKASKEKDELLRKMAIEIKTITEHPTDSWIGFTENALARFKNRLSEYERLTKI